MTDTAENDYGPAYLRSRAEADERLRSEMEKWRRINAEPRPDAYRNFKPVRC